MKIAETDNDLVRRWQSHAWRAVPSAPGVHVLQALLDTGHTASGLGSDGESALARCLGETAEKLSLACHPERDLMAVSAMFCGYASHWDSQFAQAHARHEAIERRDVLKWWQGGILATPIPLDDPSVGRLAKWVAQARTGATVARSTALWSLPALSKNSVTIIARTQKLDGSEVMLGFGTANTPHTAAAKAVREAILMEVALFETQAWQADRSPIDLKYTAAKIDLYARRCPELLPVSAKQASCPNPAHEEPIYSALTSPIDGRSVWMCRLPSVAPSPISSADHPFI